MMVDDNYIIVTCLGGGWYSFSPSGYRYYNNHDVIKVQGINKLVKSMRANGVHAKQIENSCMVSHKSLQLILKA